MVTAEATTPVDADTAPTVRTCCQTIHGWRPTSVVTQPASMATMAAPPAATAAHQNTRCSGGARRLHHDHANHAASTRSADPMPTMIWNDQCTTLTGGRSAASTASNPGTSAFTSRAARNEASPGISMAPTTLLVGPRGPWVVGEACLAVRQITERLVAARPAPTQRRAWARRECVAITIGHLDGAAHHERTVGPRDDRRRDVRHLTPGPVEPLVAQRTRRTRLDGRHDGRCLSRFQVDPWSPSRVKGSVALAQADTTVDAEARVPEDPDRVGFVGPVCHGRNPTPRVARCERRLDEDPRRTVRRELAIGDAVHLPPIPRRPGGVPLTLTC